MAPPPAPPAPSNFTTLYGTFEGYSNIDLDAFRTTQTGTSTNAFNSAFGRVSLSDDGSIIAIAAPNAVPGGQSGCCDATGIVQVFKDDGQSWNQMGNFLTQDNNEGPFGYSISLSGDGTRLAVGSLYYGGNYQQKAMR